MVSKAVDLKSSLLLLFLAVHYIDNSCCLVEQLSNNKFDDILFSESLVLALFKSDGDCPECAQAEKILEQVPQSELLDKPIEKRSVSDSGLAERYGVASLPAVVFFRNGYPALYDGKLNHPEDAEELGVWLESALNVATHDLHEDSFEHLTQASTGATTGDWFVFFYDPGCECCRKHLPALESAAIRQKYRMNFAKVDVKSNKKLADRFKITKEPTAYLIVADTLIYGTPEANRVDPDETAPTGAVSSGSTLFANTSNHVTMRFKQGKMYLYEPEKYNPQSIVSFVDSWYKNVKASPVPGEPTAFDALTQNIADYLKENMNDPGRRWIVIGAGVVSLLLIVFIVIQLLRTSSDSRQKYD